MMAVVNMRTEVEMTWGKKTQHRLDVVVVVRLYFIAVPTTTRRTLPVVFHGAAADNDEDDGHCWYWPYLAIAATLQ